MTVEASTQGRHTAAAHNSPGFPVPIMNRFFLIAAAVGLLAIAVGVLALGAFPPDPRPQPVQKVLPNDKFQTH